MPFYWIAFVLLSFFVLEILYFQLAKHFNIIDKPNHRSSHSAITIRGGGIIFYFSCIAELIFFECQHYYFIIGVSLLSLVSFIDDIKPLSSKLRFSTHFIAALLLLQQVGFLNWNVLSFFLIIFIVAIINAVNFMDGINGLTGAYSLLTLSTLLFINEYYIFFYSSMRLLMPILALIVFLFFNFRNKAACFAGDVGSITMAFIILYFLITLVLKTRNAGYMLLLLVYGMDTLTTIAFRLIRGENILQAHRSHYYQFLANDKKIPHLHVALIYVAVQALANIIFIHYLNSSIIYTVAFTLLITSSFIILRLLTEGPKKLLGKV